MKKELGESVDFVAANFGWSVQILDGVSYE